MAYIGNPAAPTLAQVSDNTITSAKIVDGAVGTADIADDAVTAAKISNTEDFVVNGLTVGKGAGNVATNTAVGVSALAANTTGSGLTALGQAALFTNTASNNTALGKSSLTANTSGTENSAGGKDSLGSNTTGSYNTAFGSNALVNNTTASRSTAVGYQAGYSQTAAGYTVNIGSYAGWSYASGAGNGYNVNVGDSAGYSATGFNNTFIGDSSGSSMTTGSRNTILGRYNGNQGGLDIRTASNRIVLSDGDGNPRMFCGPTGSWYMRSNTSTTQSLEVTNDTNSTGALGQYIGMNLNQSSTSSYALITGLYGSSDRCYIYANGNIVNINNSYGALSDARLKENIVDAGSQWDDIKALRVRKYSMKEDASPTPNKLGVIAQELEEVGMSGLVFESPDRQNEGETIKQVNYSVLYMKAVKALQEAMTRIEQLEADVATLKGN